MLECLWEIVKMQPRKIPSEATQWHTSSWQHCCSASMTVNAAVYGNYWWHHWILCQKCKVFTIFFHNGSDADPVQPNVPKHNQSEFIEISTQLCRKLCAKSYLAQAFQNCQSCWGTNVSHSWLRYSVVLVLGASGLREKKKVGWVLSWAIHVERAEK